MNSIVSLDQDNFSTPYETLALFLNPLKNSVSPTTHHTIELKNSGMSSHNNLSLSPWEDLKRQLDQ